MSVFDLEQVQETGHHEDLAAFLGFGEIPFLDGEVAEGHYDQSRTVLARAARDAGHAFAAVPDGFALEQGFDGVVVPGLDYGDYLPWVISVELRRRAHRRAGAAVDTGMETFLEAVILIQFLEIIHRQQK